MMKRIGALGFAVVLLIYSGFVSWAAVCGSSNSPDGAHDFSVCKRADAGYSVDKGTCVYIYGWDQNGNPIYKNDCRISDRYQWCNYICKYCNQVNDTQGAHPHYVKTVHSVNHN